jgi:hypothetical protein
MSLKNKWMQIIAIGCYAAGLTLALLGEHTAWLTVMVCGIIFDLKYWTGNLIRMVDKIETIDYHVDSLRLRMLHQETKK